ncbi:MAG: putative zinc-binding metallopeptidase, partial [Candidatus Binatia bacterium]
MSETAKPHWSELSDDELLNLRFRDLGLKIDGTYLEGCVQQLYRELDERKIRLQPPCYLGDEWFSPDGVPAIAIPFYLAHPRLQHLEKKMMMEVEGGGGAEDTMRFLRHECGHTLCHAFLLTERRDWKKVFGSPSKEFQDHYRFQPYSRNFVRHLENWYAQSHPEEDFAETFSVWLTPGIDWKAMYRGWPALRKLEFVDTLMQELADKPPLVKSGRKVDDVRRLRRRLRTHYEQRRKLYAEEYPSFFDADLRRIFVDKPAAASNGVPASRFLRRQRTPILDVVSFWTRERKFTLDRVLKQLITRCDELKLCVPRDEDRAKIEAAVYLSALASNYLFTGRLK